MDIYVNHPEKANNFNTISEALESISGGFSEDSEKSSLYKPPKNIFPAEISNLEPVTIHIGEGIYREKLVVTRPNITFEGEGRDKTVIVYGHGAFEAMPDGEKRGTFRTASVRISTHDFVARNLTFKNDAGFGHTVGQALALYIDGDRNAFFNCALIGSQDTLFTAPLPLKEAKPGGFRGPGEFTERILGRHYFKDCFLQGDVDFIFGGAVSFFEDCEIFSKLPEDRTPPEDPTQTPEYGYVTAASTPQGRPFGYVFKNCRLTSDCPEGSVYLGRPWREWARTVFLNCELGEHINPLGWKDWNKDHDHFYYGEYKSYGPGALPDKRAGFSHQLTDEEAMEYTLENVLEGWIPK